MSNRSVLFASLLALIFAAEALAHGGSYRLPPPVPRIPTPGGGLPTPTPPNRDPGTVTPGLPKIPGGQLPSGPGGRLNRPPPIPAKDPVAWESWWVYNRERYLEVRRTVSAHRTATGGEDVAGPAGWRARAIDALLVALGDKHEDISTGSALALGKSGDARGLLPLLEALKDRRADRTLRESAALALGMLGNETGRELLTEVMMDRAEAARLRAFAAFGLGLTGSPAAVPGLAAVIRNRKVSMDPRAAALIAAGHLGDEILVPILEKALSGAKTGLSSWERACAADGLGRIAAPDSLPLLLRALNSKDASIRRAAVLALGRVPEPDGQTAFDALGYLARSDGDRVTRAYATISLARRGRPEAVANLEGIADGARDAAHRGFGVLALGILARECEDDALTERIASFLRGGLMRGKLSEDLKGAACAALGVIRDRKAVPVLTKVLEGGGNPVVRGHAAIALAMIGDREALPALREALDPKGQPQLLREVALAVGLLGDSESTRRLVDLVRDGSSEWVRGNAALALGRIGGPEAASAMIELLADRHSSAATRGMAAVSLGHMLDERDVPGCATNLWVVDSE